MGLTKPVKQSALSGLMCMMPINAIQGTQRTRVDVGFPIKGIAQYRVSDEKSPGARFFNPIVNDYDYGYFGFKVGNTYIEYYNTSFNYDIFAYLLIWG